MAHGLLMEYSGGSTVKGFLTTHKEQSAANGRASWLAATQRQGSVFVRKTASADNRRAVNSYPTASGLSLIKDLAFALGLAEEDR